MAEHPLAPLSENEIRQTAAVLRRDRGVNGSWRFASIELKEPSKTDVKAWRPGDPVPCSAFAVLWDRQTNETWEGTVDLVGDRVLSLGARPRGVPHFTVDEYHDVDRAMRAHPDVVAVLADRGITDMSLVLVEVWTYGRALMPEQYRDRRLGWCDIWHRATPEGNPYAHPVSGLARRGHEHPRPARDRERPRPRAARGRRRVRPWALDRRATHRPQAPANHPAGRYPSPSRATEPAGRTGGCGSASTTAKGR